MFCRKVVPSYSIRNNPRSRSSGMTRSTKSLRPPGRVDGWIRKPSTAMIVEPGLHLIDDHRRGADHRPLAASAGETLIQLADRQPLVTRPIDDLTKPGLAGVGAQKIDIFGQGTVYIVTT